MFIIMVERYKVCKVNCVFVYDEIYNEKINKKVLNLKVKKINAYMMYYICIPFINL